jgi:hypothetical protein
MSAAAPAFLPHPQGSGYLTIPAEIHGAVMALPPNERADRQVVNAAVRGRLRFSEHRAAPTTLR